MVTNLDRAAVEAYVEQPGVVLINWRSPSQPLSVVFDAGYENVSARHPDVHFAGVDVGADPALAESWSVAGAPELMAYRDGTLVFDYAGMLPEMAVDALIDAIWALDMQQIRQGTNGHGTRLVISAQAAGAPKFDLGRGGSGGPNRAPGGQSAAH
jgi:thioredoxin